MLSGGEPTLYPWLAELLDEVAERPIVRVLVNTNGLAIAQDDELLELLRGHRERVEVYLQYDGESAEASTTTAAPTSAGSRSGRSSACRAAGSSPPSR